MLDLLRVAVGAGLDAVARARRGRPPPSRRARRRARRGGAPDRARRHRAPTRSTASSGARPAAGVHALAQALRRADRLGAPPGRALAALAEEARARQARRLAEQAARAAPKIQLVVALLLVPSVLLLVAAALIPALTGASL